MSSDARQKAGVVMSAAPAVDHPPVSQDPGPANFRPPRLLGAWGALGLFALQFVTIALAPDEWTVRVVVPATIALAALALWPYRRWLGVWMMYVGLTANLAVILANGGLMPIERATVVRALGEERAAKYEIGRWIPGSKDVLVADGGGRATALGDSITVPLGAKHLAASPGDLVIWAGLAVLGAEAAVEWRLRRRPQVAPGQRGRAPEAAPGGAATQR